MKISQFHKIGIFAQTAKFVILPEPRNYHLHVAETKKNFANWI